MGKHEMDRNERIEQMRQEYRARRENPDGQSQQEQGRRQAPRRRNRFRLTLFFPLSILLMELTLRVWFDMSFWGSGLIYAILFAIGAGMVCNLIVSIGPERLRRVLHWVTLCFLTLLFGIQIVHYHIFNGFAGVGHIGVAGDAITNFFMDMIAGIVSSTIPLLITFIPLAVFILKKLWKQAPIRRPARMIRTLLAAIVFHILVIGSIMLNSSGILPLNAVYREHFTMNLGVPNFGLVTSMRLDIRYTIFGRPEADITGGYFMPEAPTPTPSGTEPHDPNGEEPYDPGPTIPLGFAGCYYNILPIDFEALLETETNSGIREMHEFFMNRRATPRNEWTGRFEGYNLVWLMGEAFHTLAIHPEITPTLYMMANEGFRFTNFYTPDTGFSTTGGEFAMVTSLIPRSVNAFPNTANNYMPFGFGNMFRDLGYETFAYHNWTYSFYRRDLSHPNLGYTWRGLGGPGNMGLPLTPRADGRAYWPTSDLEMIQLTADYFVNADNFHVYYVTVSGHLNYNFGGNAMARRHQDRVEHLPYSVGPRAYLATHVELDLALAYLIERLDAAGQLERTVFAMAADHYPYGLTDAEMAELSGTPMAEPIIDRHHSTFILWSASMEEPVEVTAFSSFYDVMPTLANLFNLPYDSRLVMGVDLLSGVDPFVPFASRSWISHLGRFNSATGVFTPHPHVDPADIPENHAQQMAGRFNVMEIHSVRIIEHDYYRIVLGNR
ncbi:MAG: LTA synthase family protein [Oscillospiraceae bacterium]|nr:LTA synthase family protein [Oscillospiraceae bacterium]